MPALPRSPRRLTIPRWETPWDAEARPDDALVSPPPVSLVVPEVERPSRTPAFAVAAVVVLGASDLAGRGYEQREPDSSSRRRVEGLFDRAHVDASCARWRDADRLWSRAQSNDVRNAGAFGRHLGPGSRWAGRRPWRVATRPGRPRTWQGDFLQGLGAGGCRSRPISRRLRER